MKLDDWLTSLAIDATPDMDQCVEMLGQQIDWLYRLKDTPQDPEWHGEGNVHIHTHCVLSELYILLKRDAQPIQGERRQALILAVLLHDIGKPVRTRTADIQGVERITSPQHESVGRSYLAFKLSGLNLSFQVIWMVLNLVGEHHMPKLLAIKNKPISDYWRLARQVDTELLYWLEVADMTGRICPDPKQQLQNLEEFKLFAEEYGLWGNTLDVRSTLKPHLDTLDSTTRDYVYAHALYQLESGKISQPDEALATTYQHRKHHSHLVVMCGPSGSGKSSWMANHYPDYAVVSLDELREKFNGDRASQKNKGQILQASKELLKTALRQKQGVVWDATNLRSDYRAIITRLGHDYHALITIVVFLLPEPFIYQNNRNRQYSVPENVLNKQLEGYQLPLLNEAHQYQVIEEKGKILYNSGFYLDANDGFLG